MPFPLCSLTFRRPFRAGSTSRCGVLVERPRTPMNAKSHLRTTTRSNGSSFQALHDARCRVRSVTDAPGRLRTANRWRISASALGQVGNPNPLRDSGAFPKSLHQKRLRTESDSSDHFPAISDRFQPILTFSDLQKRLSCADSRISHAPVASEVHAHCWQNSLCAEAEVRAPSSGFD